MGSQSNSATGVGFGKGRNMKNISLILQDKLNAHYIYDVALLKKEAALLKLLKEKLSFKKIFYSVKSNPNPYLLSVISTLVDGFDVSSDAEVDLLLNIKISPDRLTFSGPAKTNLAIPKMISSEISCVHIDSYDEYMKIMVAEKQLGKSVKKAIRLANVESVSQKLGCSASEFEKIMMVANNDKFQGFHFYLGRESFSVEKLNASILKASWALAKYPHRFVSKPEIFLGAGLPRMFFLEGETPDISKIVKHEFIINLEVGRSLVQSCGYYGARVLARKKSDQEETVIIDGGLQHMASHLGSPKFNYAGIEFYFYRNESELPVSSDIASINGSLSLWHDKLAPAVKIPSDLKRGDWVFMSPIGAYGWTAATNQFIGPTIVKEWLKLEEGTLIDVSSNTVSYLMGSDEF